MTIRITCPGCQSPLSLADELRGKKVRCKKCAAAVRVPEDEDDAEDAVELAVQTETKLKVKPKAVAEDDEEESKPAKKKKKKKKAKGGSSVILIVVAAVVVVLLLGGGGTAAFFFFKPGPAAPRNDGQAKADEKEKDERSGTRIIVPTREEGSPTKKGGKGIVSNIRGAIWRTERRNELANINKMHSAWALEPGPKALDGYLAYIKTEFSAGHGAIKDGYYRVNVNAKPGTSDIVAGERDEDNPGHLVVRGNGTIEYVSVANWKKAMGIP